MKNIESSGFYKGIVLGLITVIVSGFVLMDDHLSFVLKTSVLGYPQHEAFDGTVYPVKKVPNWVKMTSADREKNYNELSSNLLEDVPFYDPAELKVSTDGLRWGDSSDDKIRNAKITYSTPYMGSYELNGLEHDGSHPAVDIKIPIGTPIYSIANGTVVKSSSLTTGFGHHIVVRHNNFPTLSGSNDKEVVYSSYSHMSSLLVDEGDVVRKGEQIGLSGDTGTATTPHLHFQIDNDDAPWHPYWPFTWSEASDAGLDFFSAVNAGLGSDKALLTTINPLKYVQKYRDEAFVVVESSSNDSSSTADSYIPEVVEVAEVVAVETSVEVVEPESEDVVVAVVEEVVKPEPVVKEVVKEDAKFDHFEFEVASSYRIGSVANFKVMLIDQYGEVFEDGISEDVVVSGVNSKITAKSPFLTWSSFDDGVNENSFKRMSEGRDKLQIAYNDETYYSDWFNVVDPNAPVEFSDIKKSHDYYDAITYLSENKVISGYPDGTFKPDNTVTRVEALKFIYEGINKDVKSGSLSFRDTDSSQWYSNYLYTAYSDKVVTGYKDGTFKPASTVNKVEFLKILFGGMDIEVPGDISVPPYEDVKPDEWFAPYVAYAKELGIVADTQKFGPSNGMTRGEVAFAIYTLMEDMK